MKSTVKTEMIEIHTIASDDFTFAFAIGANKLQNKVVFELIAVVEVVWVEVTVVVSSGLNRANSVTVQL